MNMQKPRRARRRRAPAARNPRVTGERGMANLYFLTRFADSLPERRPMRFLRRSGAHLWLAANILLVPAAARAQSAAAAPKAPSLSERFEGLEFRAIGP